MTLLAAMTTVLACAAGFLLPGLGAARALGAPRWEGALALSLLALFHAALWVDLAGLPLRPLAVLPVLLALGAGGALAARRGGAPAADPLPAPGWRAGAAVLVGLVGAVLLARTALQPLAGFDTPFRWNHLALEALERQTLAFYPPRSAGDFAIYGYPEGIPPLVSLSYWWLYAGAGGPAPRLTALLTTAQWLACCALVARLGARFAGPRAGLLGALALACTPLFARSVAIGQEGGLVALGLLLALEALARVEAPAARDHLRLAVLAGLGAGLTALAREYGWAFLPLLLALGARRGLERRALAALAAAALLAAGPWYLRNLALTGSPFPGLAAGGLLPLSPVRAAALEAFAATNGWGHQPGGKLLLAARELGVVAAPALLGLVGLLLRRGGAAREVGLAAGLVAVLWALSVPYTDGGLVYSLRVLAPAAALLAIPAGELLARVEARLRSTPRGRVVRAAGAATLVGWGLAWALAFPARPAQLPFGLWPRYLVTTRPVGPRPEEAVAAELRRRLPAGTRVLSATAYLQPYLAGSGLEAVSPWSPEVAFLFEEDLPAPAARARLRALGIEAYLATPPSPLWDPFLARFPFFREPPGPGRERVAEQGGFALERLGPP